MSKKRRVFLHFQTRWAFVTAEFEGKIYLFLGSKNPENVFLLKKIRCFFLTIFFQRRQITIETIWGGIPSGFGKTGVAKRGAAKPPTHSALTRKGQPHKVRVRDENRTGFSPVMAPSFGADDRTGHRGCSSDDNWLAWTTYLGGGVWKMGKF
jgi:hypothetical protein